LTATDQLRTGKQLIAAAFYPLWLYLFSRIKPCSKMNGMTVVPLALVNCSSIRGIPFGARGRLTAGEELKTENQLKAEDWWTANVESRTPKVVIAAGWLRTTKLMITVSALFMIQCLS
jgi:hypothetical protein